MNLTICCLMLTMQGGELTGVARIREDSRVLSAKVSTEVARDFLKGAEALPGVEPRTLYVDPVKKAYLTEPDAEKLEAGEREKLKKLSADENLYYNTRYGSPLAYVGPMELLGKAGLESLAGKKVLDFGCGGIGPLRLMAAQGADAVGVDVDSMLAALYSETEDQGAFKEGRVSLVIGRFPADEAVKAKVGGGYDLFLSKNTLKRGYVHPDEGKAFIDLGMDDSAYLKTLYESLKPGGFVLIYNLGPAPAAAGQAYKAMADVRTPFARRDWESAGFRVLAFDEDDTGAAREMGGILGWDKGPGGMDLSKDLFATYTLVQKP